jgi:uncharacterized membrane protein HdeD (DUF308 family)
MFREVEQRGKTQVTKYRWALGLSGAFGIAVIVWPSISLYSLVIVFGAFALARGVIGLGTTLSGSLTQGAAGSCSRAWPGSRSA